MDDGALVTSCFSAPTPSTRLLVPVPAIPGVVMVSADHPFRVPQQVPKNHLSLSGAG